MAALLYGTVPFAAAWIIALAADRRAVPFLAIFCGLALAVLLLGIVTAASRAGAVLGLSALVCSAFLLHDSGARRPRHCSSPIRSATHWLR